MGNQDLLLEVLPTRGTLEWPVLNMAGLVELELGPAREDLPTLAATVGLVLGVDPLVGDEGDLLAETSSWENKHQTAPRTYLGQLLRRGP